MGRKAITAIAAIAAIGNNITGPANDGGYRHKSPVRTYGPAPGGAIESL